MTSDARFCRIIRVEFNPSNEHTVATMEPILDKDFTPVATVQGKLITGADGAILAALEGPNVILSDSRRIGTFDGGCFRDLTGKVVAFLPGAVGGIATLVGLTAAPAAPAIRAVPVLPYGGWSTLCWNEFISGNVILEDT